MLRFTRVVPSSGLTVVASLTDGSTRHIDLAPFLTGGVFAPIAASRARFEEISVDPVSRTLGWPGGLELDPEVLLGHEVAAS